MGNRLQESLPFRPRYLHPYCISVRIYCWPHLRLIPTSLERFFRLHLARRIPRSSRLFATQTYSRYTVNVPPNLGPLFIDILQVGPRD